jgi:hypothetical protein
MEIKLLSVARNLQTVHLFNLKFKSIGQIKVNELNRKQRIVEIFPFLRKGFSGMVEES